MILTGMPILCQSTSHPPSNLVLVPWKQFRELRRSTQQAQDMACHPFSTSDFTEITRKAKQARPKGRTPQPKWANDGRNITWKRPETQDSVGTSGLHSRERVFRSELWKKHASLDSLLVSPAPCRRPIVATWHLGRFCASRAGECSRGQRLCFPPGLQPLVFGKMSRLPGPCGAHLGAGAGERREVLAQRRASGLFKRSLHYICRDGNYDHECHVYSSTSQSVHGITRLCLFLCPMDFVTRDSQDCLRRPKGKTDKPKKPTVPTCPFDRALSKSQGKRVALRKI